MKGQQETRSLRMGEIAVESDWATTYGSVLLFVICALLLLAEVRRLILGHITVPPHVHMSFRSIWNWVFEGIAAAYCLILAFRFPRKPVRLAWALAGIYFAGCFLLSCFHLSLGMQHIAGIGRSILYQIALVISCLVIADWLRSVVRRVAPSEPQGGNS